jgi:hypothetical protein
VNQMEEGPKDWSDPDWPGPVSEALRRRRPAIVLPPWALLAIAAAIVIALCVISVFAIRALTRGRAQETPTSPAIVTPVSTVEPTAPAILPTTALPPPTATLVPPTATSAPSPTPAAIAPGATVVVQGTAPERLNLRSRPTTGSGIIATLRDGTVLAVTEGPREAEGYTWWRVRTANGQTGWAAEQWLALQMP